MTDYLLAAPIVDVLHAPILDIGPDEPPVFGVCNFNTGHTTFASMPACDTATAVAWIENVDGYPMRCTVTQIAGRPLVLRAGDSLILHVPLDWLVPHGRG